MNTDLIKKQTPEERELEKKKVELAALEAELADRELELATLQGELHAFENLYLRKVGSLYAELDGIKAKIARARARLNPEDDLAEEEADEAEERAQESEQSAGEAQEAPARAKFKPSDELKKMYRDIARQVHPDLASDEAERERRNRIMAEVNRAYEAGDEERLQAILREWQSSPESVKDEGIGAELIRVIRQIAQAEERIATIDEAFDELQNSELQRLRDQIEEAELEDRDLLSEMAKEITAEIAEAKAEGFDVLAELISRLDSRRTAQRDLFDE